MSRRVPAAHLFINGFAISQLARIARRNIQTFPMYLIGDTNPNWIDVIESIQVRDSYLVDSVDHARVTSCHGVEPATSALASRCRAKLASQMVQPCSQLRVLRRQRPLGAALGGRPYH